MNKDKQLLGPLSQEFLKGTKYAPLPPSAGSGFLWRLMLCASWQFRRKVVRRSAKEWCEGMAQGITWVFQGVFVILFGLIVSPLLHCWHFSFGIVWHAATLSDSKVERLRAINQNTELSD